jgi:hypothetical protein
MPDNRPPKFYVDWWNIRKSTIYGIIAVVVLIAGLVGGVYYASKSNWFIPDPKQDIPKDSARILSFEGEVRITRAATRDTIIVKNIETYASPGDIIQTMADGRAIIQMIDGSRYQLRPNAAITIKDSRTFLGGRDVRVSLDDGQLNVRTDAQNETNNVVEVADTENKLMSNTDATFDADSETNQGEIRISRGGVETTIGGEKTTIGENEYASVANGKLSAKERLMAAPRPLSPDNSAQIVDPGRGANVAFAWQDAEGNPAASYFLQISRSPTFASDAIMVDRSGLTAREFRLSSLSPGNYYWRVKATGRSGQTTNWNDAWKFMIVRAGDNVAIDASGWAVENVGGNVYLISGHTNPGVSIKSQGRETNSGADGSFKMQISSGSIETPVEISDDRGNRAGFIISLRNGAVLRRY